MGWDTERFPGVNLELVCCICNGILDSPVELPCRHIFCNECIDKWLTTKRTCPQCRAHSRKRDIKQVAPLLKNIINKQVIYCDNRENGCLDEVSLESLPRHLNECPFLRVACVNQGCGHTVFRKDLTDHQLCCTKRPILCTKGCSKAMPMDEYDDHNCLGVLKTEITDCHLRIGMLTSRISTLEENVNSMYHYMEVLKKKENASMPSGSERCFKRLFLHRGSSATVNVPKRSTQVSQITQTETLSPSEGGGLGSRQTTQVQSQSRISASASNSRVRARSRSPMQRGSGAMMSIGMMNGLSDRISTTLPGSLDGGTMSVHVSSHQMEIPNFSTSDTTDSSDFSMSSSSTESSDID